MINKLTIHNFKSIESMKLACKKYNIFIGEPNTGKSNILETLGLFSYLWYGGDVKKYLRIDYPANLFFNAEIGRSIKIKLDKEVLSIKYSDDKFLGNYNNGQTEFQIFSTTDMKTLMQTRNIPFAKHILFYRYFPINDFVKGILSHLLPPDGKNLPWLILNNKEIRVIVTDLLKKFGLKIYIKQQGENLEIIRELDDIFVELPYTMLSDTLKRLIFYLVAIETSKDCIITLEEPESNSFPYYTKFLAERIAHSKNQFFITTHNPYFLISILEKTKLEETAIFITEIMDQRTVVHPVPEEKISELLDANMDVFLNLDKFK